MRQCDQSLSVRPVTVVFCVTHTLASTTVRGYCSGLMTMMSIPLLVMSLRCLVFCFHVLPSCLVFLSACYWSPRSMGSFRILCFPLLVAVPVPAMSCFRSPFYTLLFCRVVRTCCCDSWSTVAYLYSVRCPSLPFIRFTQRYYARTQPAGASSNKIDY